MRLPGPRPRAAVLIGEMLLTTFGVAGVYFAEQGRREAAAKVDEREAFYAALREVTPSVPR